MRGGSMSISYKKLWHILLDKDLKKKGQEKLKRLLNDKIEMNEWFVDY